MSLLSGQVSGLLARLGAPGLAASESPAQRRRQLERELAEAQRKGYWFTEEDRLLVREHEARLASQRRGELVRQAGQSGAVALLLLACVQPLLWPLALVGGVKAFPRTSRRIGIGLAIGGGLGLIGSGVIAVQLGRTLMGPASLPTPALSSPSAAPWAAALSESRERGLAERIERASEGWTLQGTSPDGSPTWRQGLYQQSGGTRVMVLPRSAWDLLAPDDRQALARQVSAERDVRAIHLGRVVPASGFEDSRIGIGERVWP